MAKTRFNIFLILVAVASAVAMDVPDARMRDCSAEEPLSLIGFGSCARQSKPQPVWDAVLRETPQLFLLLGDNIYGDTRNVDVLSEKYAQFGAQPGYRALRSAATIMATWDDHDYGVNDGGGEFPFKRASQKAFLDFFEAPADDPRRHRDGVYSAKVWGPSGKRVQIILLDTRFFRSPLAYRRQKAEPGEGIRGPYGASQDPRATILGAAQWEWLEAELRKPAELRLIGSSVQVLADEHGWEAWGNFPQERKRLLRLIRATRASGVVLLSGDRHFAEIAEMSRTDPNSPGYPLLEVTSSSLNVPSGNLTKAGVRFANELNRYRRGLAFFDVNYGMILIDWEAADPVLRFQVRDEKGDVVLQIRRNLSELSWRTP